MSKLEGQALVSRSYLTITEHDIQAFLNAIGSENRPEAVVTQVTLYETVTGLWCARFRTRNDNGDLESSHLFGEAKEVDGVWTFSHDKLKGGDGFQFERKLLQKGT